MYSSTCGVPLPFETKPVIESGRPGLLEYLDRPLGGDQRLVVGADQDSCSLPQGILHQGLGRGLQRRRHRLRIAQRLRSHPVLAVGAMQIAAQHSETVGQRARVGVEERLLLDGIALHSAHITPGHIEHSSLVVAHFADAGLTIGNGTAVTAGVAAHPVAIQLLVQIALTDILVDDVAKGRHK